MLHVRRLAPFVALLAAAATAGAATEWKADALFRASIHGHVFDKIEAWNEDCVLYSKVYFTAPAEAYREEAPVRNHYRFKAKVAYKTGKELISGVFFTRSAARRSYTFRRDTRDEGCWARQKQQPADVRVEGCRGEGCKVAPFD